MRLTPTLINKLEYFSRDNDIYMKRDDLLPFSFGGNKLRIASKLLETILVREHDYIVGYGSPQSNMNRILSFVAKSNNIPITIISTEEDFVETLNTKITINSGAEFILCKKEEVALKVKEVMEIKVQDGFNPFYVYGNEYGIGNERVLTSAYVEAFQEILAQEQILKINFDYIFHASGTGVTQAGLIAGNLIANAHKKIVGISIARTSKVNKPIIYKLVEEYIGETINSNSKIDKEIIFEDSYLVNGYSDFDNEIKQLIRQVYFKEGIPLDLTYTGKGFNGMMKYIEENHILNKKILFIHTGGTPLFFDHLDEIFNIKID